MKVVPLRSSTSVVAEFCRSSESSLLKAGTVETSSSPATVTVTTASCSVTETVSAGPRRAWACGG